MQEWGVLSRRHFVSWFAIVLFIPLVGCNNDPLRKVSVHGTVTFDGEVCPGAGRVTFSPVEVAEGMPNRPAAGKFYEDGKYEAMSFRPGDGLVPGKYSVGVACFDPAKLSGAPGDDDYRKASLVGESFEPLELIIKAGSGPVEFNIDVPLR
jgi:hypothetical protein